MDRGDAYNGAVQLRNYLNGSIDLRSGLDPLIHEQHATATRKGSGPDFKRFVLPRVVHKRNGLRQHGEFTRFANWQEANLEV